MNSAAPYSPARRRAIGAAGHSARGALAAGHNGSVDRLKPHVPQQGAGLGAGCRCRRRARRRRHQGRLRANVPVGAGGQGCAGAGRRRHRLRRFWSSGCQQSSAKQRLTRWRTCGDAGRQERSPVWSRRHRAHRPVNRRVAEPVSGKNSRRSEAWRGGSASNSRSAHLARFITGPIFCSDIVVRGE
jgi:hypothetical protein